MGGPRGTVVDRGGRSDERTPDRYGRAGVPAAVGGAQQHSRHLVSATVVRRLGGATPEVESDIGVAREARSRVLADWAAPDGTRRRGSTLTDLRSPRHGDHFSLWTDPHGRITTRPLDAETATTHAVLAGIGAALAVAGLVESGRRLVVWHMVRRRYARWDRAWDRAGPDWGKAGTGC